MLNRGLILMRLFRFFFFDFGIISVVASFSPTVAATQERRERTIAVDSPGTGQASIKAGLTAERMFSPVMDYLTMHYAAPSFFSYYRTDGAAKAKWISSRGGRSFFS